VRFDCQRLAVFGHAVEALAVIDELADELPDGHAYIRDELRRAANSIALNIAEGAGEFVPAENTRFYRMAKRSATECAGQILVCERLGLAEAPRIGAALDLLQRVIAMSVTLIQGQAERTRGGIDGGRLA